MQPQTRPLAGLDLWVTRPAGQADRLIALLQQAGAAVSHLPLLAIEPLPPTAAARSLLLDLDRYQAVIFISSNAARLGAEAILDLWPQLPTGIDWLAVGAATQATLAEFDITAEIPAGGSDSEALLALPQLGSERVAGRAILIVRGTGGRETLREQLQTRGARVDYLELYRRICPASTLEQIRNWSRPLPDLVIASSGEGIDHLRRALTGPLLAMLERPLLLPSTRLAQLAGELGFRQPLVADDASDDALLTCLLQWRARNAETLLA
ncbi:MAG TPA: uroporphyrinogen-III synthase [Pseudomonadales bacterium]|jgi:uroporphyrinogen-III synthase|nr:uroporphyrinogen-III synthase [Pseudomonadales bacterium]HMW82654.1 uroporphyrinogen-III synthase [Pseudomonadales bacterium]HMY95863.1 uroporphyrinogen-III synthase [Pseudomonadales bacterium]HMZ90923.1 uroporphyrinogen-III synthase [Pseudomonadales bacterium]HNC77389.1 uroporphyrinogen-III synthase [Pseudomonadales bacterium]